MQNLITDLVTVESRRRPKRRRGVDTIRAHRLPTCPATGKVRYRDHSQADDGLGSAREARMRDEWAGRESRRREVRSYKCPSCGGWHSTSLPLMPAAARPDRPSVAAVAARRIAAA